MFARGGDHRGKPRPKGSEVRGPMVTPRNQVQVLIREQADLNRNLLDAQRQSARFHYGHTDPFQVIRTTQLVALLPASAFELHVVEEDEDIDSIDQVEIADPWQIGRLHDRAHRHRAPPSSRRRTAISVRSTVKAASNGTT